MFFSVLIAACLPDSPSIPIHGEERYGTYKITYLDGSSDFHKCDKFSSYVERDVNMVFFCETGVDIGFEYISVVRSVELQDE